MNLELTLDLDIESIAPESLIALFCYWEGEIRVLKKATSVNASHTLKIIEGGCNEQVSKIHRTFR